jgi:hypothetical protein
MSSILAKIAANPHPTNDIVRKLNQILKSSLKQGHVANKLKSNVFCPSNDNTAFEGFRKCKHWSLAELESRFSNM